MEWEDKVKDIEHRFMALAVTDNLDEAMYWLAGSFKGEAVVNAGFALLTGNNVYIQELIVAKAKEVHGDD